MLPSLLFKYQKFIGEERKPWNRTDSIFKSLQYYQVDVGLATENGSPDPPARSRLQRCLRSFLPAAYGLYALSGHTLSPCIRHFAGVARGAVPNHGPHAKQKFDGGFGTLFGGFTTFHPDLPSKRLLQVNRCLIKKNRHWCGEKRRF